MVAAKGWQQIVKYIIEHPTTWGNIWDDVTRQDVDNYLGKDWEWRQSYGYIKKLAFGLTNFQLLINKKNPFVTKWVNVKSKWRSSKRYVVLLSAYQVHIYNKSVEKIHWPERDIEIPKDELHWYKWMKNKCKTPVSKFLHDKHKQYQKLLEFRRIEGIKRKNKFVCKCENVGKMTKDDICILAEEQNVKITSDIKTMKLKQLNGWILTTLGERDFSEWVNKQLCFKGECKKKANHKFKCNNCEAAFYCSSDCQNRAKRKHIKECDPLCGAIARQKVVDENKIFPPPKEQEKLKAKSKDSKNIKKPSYLDKYPKTKSWFDLNFDLFYSKLSRLQQRCTCRSGVQLPGCCAHCGCIIRLIFHVLKYGNVDVFFYYMKIQEISKLKKILLIYSIFQKD